MTTSLTTTRMASDGSQAGYSNSPSETSATESRSHLCEPVRKCIKVLEKAETDTERFAALFLVPKLVKTGDCDKKARMHLVEAIGYSFLARMLRSKDTPEGCSPRMYQSVALSVLSCFVADEEIMTNPSVLFNLPELLDIIGDADNEIFEDNLLLINDAYQVIMAVVSTQKGRLAFISNRGIHYLCEINVKQTFQCEDALKLILNILTLEGHKCWHYYSGPEDFNNLMVKFCREFSILQDELKFELCDVIRTILRSFPKSNFDDEAWLPWLQKGLHDILFSKITKKQRDPAMMLVASVIEVSDFEWCLTDNSETQERSRFFLIILNLATIEVIMLLEELTLDEIMANSELLVSCYYIIESAVSYMASDRLLLLDHGQRGQLYTAMKNGFASILRFLQELSETLGNQTHHLEDQQKKYFVCATIRLLGAWLSEESMAMREEVCEILPFILTLSNQTFETQKLTKLSMLPGRGYTDSSDFTESNAMMQGQGAQITPDTLRFLLPALCHLISEEPSRQILIEMKIQEILYAYLSYHWTIFDSYKKWLDDQAEAEDSADVAEPFYMIDNAKFEMVNSKYAMTTICNILMNLIVLETKAIEEEQIFFHLLKFIMNTLPSLENNGEVLVLYGNLVVLGLLILQKHKRRPKSTDYSIFRYIQAVVRFLWDAHNCEEAREEEELVVSAPYIEHWNDLIDLWYLGMQVLSNVLQTVPWLTDFIVDSGWAQEIVRTLGKVRPSRVERGTLSAFEDFLSALVRGNSEVAAVLKENGVINVCQLHKMKELSSVLQGVEAEKKSALQGVETEKKSTPEKDASNGKE
ncbi:neurochondrin homolog [Eurytemora carolleeae]|uniref:neurochondrin homolog n=1 Tax=Eurytemora carolleeae TaxID=1294199 RepID=UPI000C77E6C9|nr:neurochondrin homolog [Eurytemora carolleeae]|eukprot:XP_023331282.1 neurochondrin homolog [Eurytemora affinis]